MQATVRPHRGETATILYPGAPLKLQPFCYSGDRYNILPALLRARHGNYNLFFKKGSHRLNWQFARPIRRKFAQNTGSQKGAPPFFIMRTIIQRFDPLAMLRSQRR